MENKEKGVEEVEISVVDEKTTESFLQRNFGVNGKKGKISKYFNIRIISLFVLGVLLGFAIKSQTVQTLVTGANDPKLEKTRGDYLLSTMGQKKVEEETINEENSEINGDESDAENGAGEELETKTEVPAGEPVPAE